MTSASLTLTRSPSGKTCAGAGCPTTCALVTIKPSGRQMIPAPIPWRPLRICTRLRCTCATTDAISLFNCVRSSAIRGSSALADPDGQVTHLPAAHDPHRHGLPDALGAQQGHQVSEFRYRLAVEADQNVTDEEAALIRGAARLDGNQQQAHSLSQRALQLSPQPHPL